MKTRCPWCGDDPLYVKYHDEEWGVRMYSAEALGKVGSNKHINSLKSLLSDEHEWPRKEAQKSITKLRSQ